MEGSAPAEPRSNGSWTLQGAPSPNLDEGAPAHRKRICPAIEGIGSPVVFCPSHPNPMTTPSSPAPVKAILWGGMLGGLGDWLFAHLFYAWRLGVFQNVAGGILGRETARAGGVPTYALGVALHFLIAVIWAAIFWGLGRRLPALVKHPVPAGLGYGLVIYLGMNCVVLPLSALQVKFALPPLLSWPAAAHLVLVGLPIALVAKHFSAATVTKEQD